MLTVIGRAPITMPFLQLDPDPTLPSSSGYSKQSSSHGCHGNKILCVLPATNKEKKSVRVKHMAHFHPMNTQTLILAHTHTAEWRNGSTSVSNARGSGIEHH
jgi:hypothetical protein